MKNAVLGLCTETVQPPSVSWRSISQFSGYWKRMPSCSKRAVIGLSPTQFDHDAAELEQAVQGGEVEGADPLQAAILAGTAQFGAVVGAAMPHAAAHRPGKGVLRGHQQHLASRLQYA